MDTQAIPLSQFFQLESLSSVNASNLLRFSEDFSKPVWGNYAGTKIVANTNIQSPVAGVSAQSVTGSSSIFQDNGMWNTYNSIGQYTFNFYVHNSSTASYINPVIWFKNPDVFHNYPNYGYAGAVKFKPQNGQTLSVTGLHKDSYYSKYVGNGWYKYSLTVSQTSAIDVIVRPEIYYQDATSLNLTNKIIIWGAQLVRGAHTETYVKTLSTQKASLIERDFINLKKIEPALGLPYTFNLLTSSQNLSASGWSTSHLSAKYIPNTTAPTGEPFAFKLIPDTANNYHILSRTVKVPYANQPYTLSVFLSSFEYRYALLKIDTPDNNHATSYSAEADIQAGTILSTSGNITDGSASIIKHNDSWHRLSITGTYSSFNNFSVQLFCGQYASTNLTFPGNNSKGIYAWGFQLERGTSATDYIPTYNSVKSGVPFNFANTSNVLTNTISNSAYYFLVASQADSHSKSRRFTGNDSLMLKNNNISYANQIPTYNLDVSGNFQALNTYINVVSTNYITGSALSFNNFKSVNFNSDVNDFQSAYGNFISANNVFVSHLSSLSTRYDYFPVPSISADYVFSSITWNVTAGGNVSARNIFVDSLKTRFISARNTFFKNLTSSYYTVNSNVSTFTLSASNIHGVFNLDPTSRLYYENKVLTTKLSASYFFGVKPSDKYATDNISYVRGLTGLWDKTNTIETLPVLKPYFKNVKQVFDYVKKYNLHGDDLNILVYDDILQDNVNNDTTTSIAGCEYTGNISVQHVTTPPSFLQAAGLKAGDYVWNKENSADINGKISYWNVDTLKFVNLNIVGMYEIGTLINNNGNKQYTFEKPFNVPPRKISFRTYVCANPTIAAGNFGSDPTDWTLMYAKSGCQVLNRQISFNAQQMDVNIKNLCFEFDCNNNDSTGLFFKSGNSYLSNVTIALLGSAYYPYGAIYAWPKATVYVCGVNQIDPYLLSIFNWNDWVNVPGAKNQNYFPGYGIAVVGNPDSRNLPTLIPSFFKTWRSEIFFMDYNINRRIGFNSYLNASIILDGNFSSQQFYELKDHSKIYSNNYIFKTNNFTLSNYNANIFQNNDHMYNGSYKNVILNTNRDNFYYVNMTESFAKFEPHYFEIIQWSFDDSLEPLTYSNDKTHFTAKFVTNNNPNYIFFPDTQTITLSGMLFGDFYKNTLADAWPLNDKQKIYNYIDPTELPSYDTDGLYSLTSPIDGVTRYSLAFYAP
jgi:hypothetical protein